METINIQNPNNLETTLTGVAQAARNARDNLVILDNQLLTLRLNFGKLRAAIGRAFAPIAGAIAPALNSALKTLTDFCDSVGAVMAALFGTVYKKAVTTTKTAGAAIKRTLTSFDELERLNGVGGGGSSTIVTLEPVNDELTPSLQLVVDRIRVFVEKVRQLLSPLYQIDLTPARDAFTRLGQTLILLGASICEALEWAWFNLLVPLSTWTIEALVPASVNLLTEAFRLLGAVFGPLVAGIQTVLPALKPIAQFIGETLLGFLGNLGQQFRNLIQVFADNAPRLGEIFTNLGQIISALWDFIAPVLQTLREGWNRTLESMRVDMSGWITGITELLYQLTEFVSGALTGNWNRAWEGLKGVFRGVINGIISLANSLLRGLAGMINNIAAVLNSWSVTIPEWVPEFGGRTFGFAIGTVTPPQIPYLAKGAVLPAGKPFLAMVGDQRHGTNIEAPLTTIQEAVALTMEDLSRSNMAGHEATAELLAQILTALGQIRIGDDAIAAAADRSYSRRSVMKGVSYAP